MPRPDNSSSQGVQEAANGDIIEVLATDPGFKPDVQAWAKRTGNELVELSKESVAIKAVIRVTAKK